MLQPTRRDFVSTALTTALAAELIQSQTASAAAPEPLPFRYCLNTATLRGQKLGIVELVDITARAGYTGIEPWIDELDRYVKEGGSLPDLKKRIADQGLLVESAIGFAAFLAVDPAERKKGLEEAKRCMDLVRSIGGARIAAPPVGVTENPNLNLLEAGAHYRALLDLGVEMGVTPQLELWGFSKALSRLGEVAFVGIESSPAKAAYLLDTYHIHKGGSDFGGLAHFPGDRMFCFHINDYPADPPREKIGDEHRVYPGDGSCPLKQVYATLKQIGFQGTLSLELFNRTYWSQDPFEVAKTGLEKTRASVEG